MAKDGEKAEEEGMTRIRRAEKVEVMKRRGAEIEERT
jgi:hypothetical protein